MIREAVNRIGDNETSLIEAARAGDHEAFRLIIEPFQRELQLHCYRMLGSLHDAEDLLQDVLFRAWQKLESFRGRGSLRSWLYKIATNACLDALKRRPRRVLPFSNGPAADPAEPVQPDVLEPIWLEPYPDTLLNGLTANPEARFTLRESVSLAFLAAIQILPGRQRAVLILHDVLDWRAAEIAGLLDASVASVNSALQRARATLRKRFPAGAPDAIDGRAPSQVDRRLLDRYLHAWDAGDSHALAALLREDAILTMPPTPSWYLGRDAVALFFETAAFNGELGGRLRLVPSHANLQPAFAVYRRDPDGVFRAMALQVLTVEAGLIRAITGFVNVSLFPAFGLPTTLLAGA